MNTPKIVAGNWKMNLDANSVAELCDGLESMNIPSDVEVIVAPPFPFISAVGEALKGASIKVAAQNCHQLDSGAYTGEVSPKMLASLGVTHVILGHSERRGMFHESNELLLEKTNKALEHGLKVIFCCGEALEIREAGTHTSFVLNQLKEGPLSLSPEDFAQVTIAYEPIWAIGTGVTASPEQAQDMHAAIRKAIVETYGEEVASNTAILYGGSCKPGNAKDLFANDDINGGLIGGAALKANDFEAIINSYS